MKTEDEIKDEAWDWKRRQHIQFPFDSIEFLYIKIRMLEEQLKDLVPTEEQLAKYPSLREAYEQFFILKRLTKEDDKT